MENIQIPDLYTPVRSLYLRSLRSYFMIFGCLDRDPETYFLIVKSWDIPHPTYQEYPNFPRSSLTILNPIFYSIEVFRFLIVTMRNINPI